MKKIKVITILGTRPEIIKLAPVIHELTRHKKDYIQSGSYRTAQKNGGLVFEPV